MESTLSPPDLIPSLDEDALLQLELDVARCADKFPARERTNPTDDLMQWLRAEEDVMGGLPPVPSRDAK